MLSTVRWMTFPFKTVGNSKLTSVILSHALKKTSAENWIKNTLYEFGEFDSVINCAGVLSKVPFLFKDGEEEDILNTLNINFLAIWNLCRLSWDNLCASGRGRIIVLVSMSGIRSKGDLAAYSSSKFAVRCLTQCWQAELRPFNIRVCQVNPSEVTTAFGNTERVERSEVHNKLTVREISHAIISAIEMDDRGFINELNIWATNPF